MHPALHAKAIEKKEGKIGLVPPAQQNDEDSATLDRQSTPLADEPLFFSVDFRLARQVRFGLQRNLDRQSRKPNWIMSKLVYDVFVSDPPPQKGRLPKGDPVPHLGLIYELQRTAVEGPFLKMPNRWATRASLCSISTPITQHRRNHNASLTQTTGIR